MNNNRRKLIAQKIERLNELKDLIEEIKCYEEESFGNLSENLQITERGQKMETAIENLDEAIGAIDTAVECLEMAME